MKRLGGAEQETRDALERVGGRWKPGERPLWENNAYWTQEILYSLVKKGHADITKEGAFVLIADALPTDRRLPRS